MWSGSLSDVIFVTFSVIICYLFRLLLSSTENTRFPDGSVGPKGLSHSIYGVSTAAGSSENPPPWTRIPLSCKSSRLSYHNCKCQRNSARKTAFYTSLASSVGVLGHSDKFHTWWSNLSWNGLSLSTGTFIVIRLEEVLSLVYVGAGAEVNNFGSHLSIDHNIIGFQVSVQDSIKVQKWKTYL